METRNAFFVGVGGQGVILASDLFCHIVLAKGLEAKKTEIHGLSQRGGAVASQVRFGQAVYSPLPASGDADFVIAFDKTEGERNRVQLREGGLYVGLEDGELDRLPNIKTANVYLLAKFLRESALELPNGDGLAPLGLDELSAMVSAVVPPKFLDDNLEALELAFA